MRAVYLVLGFVSLGVAFVGVALPLIPTTGPVLLAAFFFAKSSERFHNWLLNHRWFGPGIRDYQAGLGIPMKAKVTAVVMIAISFGITRAPIGDRPGESILRPIGLFDPEERGGIALPALLVLDPHGNEVFGYRGRDFADRTHDEDVFAALEGLDLAPIDPPPGGPLSEVGVDQPGAFQPRMVTPYFNGNRFGAIAIQRRAEGDEAKGLAREHRLMCDGILDAWNEVKAT